MQNIFQSTKRLIYLSLFTLLIFTSASTILPIPAWAAATGVEPSSTIEIVIGFLGIIVGFFLGIFSQLT
jgi:hypothetical protein